MSAQGEALRQGSVTPIGDPTNPDDGRRPANWRWAAPCTITMGGALHHHDGPRPAPSRWAAPCTITMGYTASLAYFALSGLVKTALKGHDMSAQGEALRQGSVTPIGDPTNPDDGWRPANWRWARRPAN